MEERKKMNKKTKTDDPRDEFTLNVVAWIQDLVRSSTTLDPQRQEEEYQKLLNQPLDNFELCP
jgi:aspartate-semialdehyde dehydrogenase